MTRFPLRGAAALAAAASAGTANAGAIGPVWTIAIENHNWTQPNPLGNPNQLYSNPAAPFLNSLVDPDNPNSKYASYASAYTNAAVGLHPSEPNYIWSEAGSNFGNHTDADPSVGTGNIYDTPHLTRLLNAANITWRNYQEDVEVSGLGPTHSAKGTLPGGAVNPYYGTGQYRYACKHNPMVFFTDTQTQNVAPIGRLAGDLASGDVAGYNWVSPNAYNDMHSPLNTDFTYAGRTWPHNTDQNAVAVGDHFLSIVVPLIMASDAFQNHNGTIVIWTDESRQGDDALHTMTEIVVSRLARGGAYTNALAYTHSSDLRTWQELFGITPGDGFLNDSANALDLSDLFRPGALCYPDFAGDGTLDLFDFLAYVNAFNAGDADADCDRNGGLDLFDFLCFQNAFNAGC